MGKRRMVGPTAWILGGAGLFIGAVAAWLVSQGNPGNMGLCIACFLRDITGFFVGGTTGQGAVAYIRPEIIGIILGALGAAILTREFRPRGGSNPLLRFVLGFIFMTSALIFLGCTVRAWLRLGGGDLNALWGILGIVAGVVVGIVFLKRGFNLGRAKNIAKPLGWLLPTLAIVLLVFALVSAFGTKPDFATQTAEGAFSTGDKPPAVFLKTDGQISQVLKPVGATLAADGSIVGADGAIAASAESVTKAKPQPGGKRASLWISLAAGLAVGVVAQRSRFCSIGGIRDAVLVKRYDLLFGVVGLLIGATVVNILLGQYNLGFVGQPVAHTDALGNFASMAVATFAAMLLGGCPFRQVIMGSEGDADSFVAVAGMLVGAGFTHWAGIASSAKGLAPLAWPALGVMAAILVAVALLKRTRTA
ncbi:MAG: YedE-related selenium metabolism membrane protein [Actinobacteria bacterium HGW-Actinobacteria-6]|nr:MAG: YedE-related selenium metabolism membrane protein [Actinobacteria bacterium HGW-Actinobacteria-6]